MTDDTVGIKPLSSPQIAALRDLLFGEIPLHGNFFVTSEGTRYMAKTIRALAKQNYCHVRQDNHGGFVARVAQNIRTIIDVERNGQRGVGLIAESDIERRKWRERKARQRRGVLAEQADALAEKELV